MKYILVVLVALSAIYVVNKNKEIEAQSQALASLKAEVLHQPIDLFLFQRAAMGYVQAECHTGKGLFSFLQPDVLACEDLVSARHSACTEKVFHIAPVEITNVDDFNYFQNRFAKCIGQI